jgi:hypothetical protein
LTIDCVAKFLTYALSFLPRPRAIFAFEGDEIDCQKQAEKKDEAQRKLSHVCISSCCEGLNALPYAPGRIYVAGGDRSRVDVTESTPQL